MPRIVNAEISKITLTGIRFKPELIKFANEDYKNLNDFVKDILFRYVKERKEKEVLHNTHK